MNNKILLFSTGCPMCNVLTSKLDNAGIEYEVTDNMSEILKRGFTTVPVLKVNDMYMGFKEANKWVNEYKG